MHPTNAQIRELLAPRPTLLELLRQVERRRQPKPLEVVAYFALSLLISAAGLAALPIVITALGAIAPFAPIVFLLHRLWKVNRCSR